MTSYKHMFLIRHGESTHNAEGWYAGHTDTSLTGHGMEQAKRLGQCMREVKVDGFYSSPQKRALQTAGLAFPGCETKIRIRDELKEMHFGNFEGLTFEKISETYPSEIGKWLNMDLDFFFPSGESIGSFQLRVQSVLADIQRESEGHVAIFTHGGVIRFMLCHILQRPLKDYLSFNLPPASVTSIVVTGKEFKVNSIGTNFTHGVVYV